MSPQQTVAHYRITARLGVGGMGEVWRATDSKLNREVAIKVLPESFAADPDRLARFAREAQVLASMNHPNIAAIYGVEERALVMELVEGQTLAERIRQGSIPPDEALPLARQIAEALEYAHDRGVIHRDLKPANIKITPDGRVKVLDFGLAKAMAGEANPADPANSPTLTLTATAAGIILGTAGYMAPEQAKGKPADRRADIWAFGVVLFEMLTGKPLYTGETISEILASVIKETPSLAALPESTPAGVRRLLGRCLERDARQRLQAIGEARIALETPEPEAAAVQPVRPARGARFWQAAAGLLAVALLAAGVFLWLAYRPALRPMVRLNVDLGPGAIRGVSRTVAISPDGRRIVYSVNSAGTAQLATRLLDQTQVSIMPGTDGAADAFFSPDSQWVGFTAENKLKKVPVLGGAPVTMTGELATATGIRGVAWGADGNLVATLDQWHIYRLPASGGAPPQRIEVKTDRPGGYVSYRWAQYLPGRNAVIVTSSTVRGAYDDGEIGVLSLDTGQHKVVLHGGYFGRYVPTGHLVYVHHGMLFGVRFDLRRMETSGIPVPILQDVAGNLSTAGGQLDFSDDGTLVYLAGSGTSMHAMVWQDATGRQQPLLDGTVSLLAPRFSPDGTRLMTISDGDISVFDMPRGASARVTFNGGVSGHPVWTPDGRHIAYGAAPSGIWWTRSDGSAQPQRLIETNGHASPGSFSPDGRFLAYDEEGTANSRSIRIVPLDLSDPDHPKPGTPQPFEQGSVEQTDPSFSPDGHWLAYTSLESGARQVYVRPYPPNAGGKWQVSSVQGNFPRWSRPRPELYYVAGDGRIMATDYTVSGGAFLPGKPRPWSPNPIPSTGMYASYDLAPDGSRVVVFPPAETTGDTVHVTFLFHFFDELRRRLP
jgi:serine/threonine-protein kinase